ncbi:MAG: hypothetical protein NTU94_11130 [Planctomycetota bacterium]|nr:hypothetical protein [Planctomycetota bacterium]
MVRFAVVAVLATVALVLALLKSTPQVARRTAAMGADPAAAAKFDERVINQIGNVLLDKSGGTRLDLEITEEMVNARIAEMVRDEEQAGKLLPPALRDLRVGFEQDEIVLATRLGSGLTSVTVSQRLRLAIEPDGRLTFDAVGTRAGALPLPGRAMDYARRAVAAERARLEASKADDKTVTLWRFLGDAIEGRPIPLGEGRKRIRLDGIEIERGILKIRGHRSDTPAR